jgi:hypothetical protein
MNSGFNTIWKFPVKELKIPRVYAIYYETENTEGQNW